jgi:hypothetical protein
VTAPSTSKPRIGYRRRLAYLALVGVVSALAVAIAPGTANAALVPCPGNITEWVVTGNVRGIIAWEGHRFTLVSATPTFLVSDSRTIDNQLDTSVSTTVASSISQTYTVSTTVGVTANPSNFFSTTVSASIVRSVTTTIGVSVTATVPPHTRVIAEYGVAGYVVDYIVEAWGTLAPGGTPPGVRPCNEFGSFPQHTTAPTISEGWRLRVG